MTRSEASFQTIYAFREKITRASFSHSWREGAERDKVTSSLTFAALFFFFSTLHSLCFYFRHPPPKKNKNEVVLRFLFLLLFLFLFPLLLPFPIFGGHPPPRC
jgi:hypothetical protein